MINNEKTKGFTMAEVLVSVAIFSLLSVVLANIFVSSIKAQSKILQNQDIMEESNYALEYMGKALRMAKKDTDGYCTGGSNYQWDWTWIEFLSYDSVDGDYKCRVFAFEDDTIREYRSEDNTSSFGVPADIISSKIKVNSLYFYVTGDVSGGQPKTTIMLDLEGANSSGSKMVIQTTISQRELNID
jgi:prepilin-type N-terminal cleavage/methylation domain-containing protein